MADLPETEAPEETTAPAETEEEKPEAEGEPEAAPEGEGEGEEETKADAPEGEEEAAKADDAPDAAAQQTEEKRRRAGGFQRKIEKLEREREILLQQLQVHQRPSGPPAPAAPPKEMTPEERTAAYIDGLVDKRVAARTQQQEEQRVLADFQRRTAEVRAKVPDYEEVIMSAAHIPAPPHLQEALLTSEHGPEIMYQLAKNPAELARISALSPVIAVREIGRLEAKLASVAPAPKTTTRTATRPPAPPTSVKGTASSSRSLDELSLSEYKRAMRSKAR